MSQEMSLGKIEIIPVKGEDDLEGDGGRVQCFGHRREESMDTSASEMESVDEEVEEDEEEEEMHESISDPQLVGGEVTSPGKLCVRPKSFVEEEGSDMEAEDEEEGPVSPFDGHPMWRRHDSAGSTNRTNSFQKRMRHRSGDSMGRRRSIAATHPVPMTRFSPEMQPIPATPNSSFSSSQVYPPHHTEAVGSEGGHYRNPHSEPSKRVKQHAGTQHSNSFHELERPYPQTRISQSQSSTNYDNLLPKDPSRAPYSRVPDPAHPFILSDDHTHTGRGSNQSISSRSSSGSEHHPHSRPGMSQPASVTSLGSGRSAGSSGGSRSRRSASPDPLAELAKTPLHQLDREFIKQAISHRFGISSVEFHAEERRPRAHTHHQFPISSSSSSSSSSSKKHQQQQVVHQPLKILGEDDEDENEDHSIRQIGPVGDVPFRNKSQSVGLRHQGSHHASNSNVEQDDRPEAEQHLLSLPRKRPDDFKFTGSMGQRGGAYGQQEFVQVGVASTRDSQLTLASGGYNSDTESSPSRTLSRQREKMKEVTSPGLPPQGRSMASRFVKQPYPMDLSKTPPSRTSMSPSNESTQKQAMPESQPELKPAFTRSHEVKPTSSLPPETRGRSSSSYTSPITSSDQGGGGGGGQPSPSQRLRMQRKNSEGRVEQAKIKLGLTDDVETTRRSGREEREREKVVPVPSSQQRRQMWEELSKNISRAQIRETRSREARHEVSPSYGPGVTSLQPKMVESHHRKARSMPNYSKRAVGRPIASPPSVKTVRVVKYELPTVRKTRRINMRTYNKV